MSEVNLYRTQDPIARGAYENAALSLCAKKERTGAASFFLCGCAAGAGATTLAIEISITLAQAGWKTLLFDGDFRRGEANKRLNGQTTAGLADYVRGGAALSEVIYRTNWATLNYLPSGDAAGEDPGKLLYSAQIGDLFPALAQVYDFVIVDAPSLTSSLDAIVFGMRADATVLVAPMDGTPKAALERAAGLLEANGAKLIGVIGNKLPKRGYRAFLDDYDYFLSKRFSQAAGSAKGGGV